MPLLHGIFGKIDSMIFRKILQSFMFTFKSIWSGGSVKHTSSPVGQLSIFGLTVLRRIDVRSSSARTCSKIVHINLAYSPNSRNNLLNSILTLTI